MGLDGAPGMEGPSGPKGQKGESGSVGEGYQFLSREEVTARFDNYKSFGDGFCALCIVHISKIMKSRPILSEVTI